MKFKYSYLAVASTDNRYIDVGVMLRSGKRLYWRTLPEQVQATVDIHQAAEDAVSRGASSVTDFWDYWLERGWGGRSSTTQEKTIQAKTVDSAARTLLKKLGNTQLELEETEKARKPFEGTPKGKENRKFKVPKGVKQEAIMGLAWNKEFNRGGTNVGLISARRLATASEIPYYGRHGVKHIANYFNRHEGDLKAEGAKPGEKGYPSAGLIAWKLWGGWPGKRWSQSIVERVEGK